ncbi:MAG: class I SAM-dependent methyltransferase [candidate division Zixibacteria bacterium]
MSDYYQEELAAEKLKQCYDLAPDRILQYLQAEIDYALSRIESSDTVLELGCGYGRLISPLAQKASTVIGIDISPGSLKYAKTYLAGLTNYTVALMDASELGFVDNQFDCVFCLQNGISAFHLDPILLISEALRVTRTGGRCIFTSYSPKIWKARLNWFELQSRAGLLGEIDYDRTGDGNIVCHDGFTASTASVEDFTRFADQIAVEASIKEIDNSTIVCEMTA